VAQGGKVRGMVRRWLVSLTMAAGVSLLPWAQAPVGARDAFVTDELQLDLRVGPGNQYRIVQMMPAGQPLRVEEVSGDWSRVTLPNGRDGWMLSRFLAERPSARERVLSIEARERELVEGNAELVARLDAANARLVELESALATGAESRDLLEHRIAEASQGLGLFEDNQLMSKQLLDTERALEDLRHEVDRLGRRHEQTWFLAGGLVLGGGLLVGLWVGRASGRRRTRWSGEL
jgi:SH3 domain protein